MFYVCVGEIICIHHTHTYMCILIYVHKSQHFVVSHFRHKLETSNWAQSTHTQTHYGTLVLKFHLKMQISTKHFPPSTLPRPSSQKEAQAEVERPRAGQMNFSLPTFLGQTKLQLSKSWVN